MERVVPIIITNDSPFYKYYVQYINMCFKLELSPQQLLQFSIIVEMFNKYKELSAQNRSNVIFSTVTRTEMIKLSGLKYGTFNNNLTKFKSIKVYGIPIISKIDTEWHLHKIFDITIDSLNDLTLSIVRK